MTVYVKLIKNKKGQGKLTPRWVGPFRVLSQLSPSGFKLQHIMSGKIKTVHPENMKVVAEESAPIDMVPQARIPLHPVEDAEFNPDEMEGRDTPIPPSSQADPTQNPSNREKAPRHPKTKRKVRQHRTAPQQRNSENRPLPQNGSEDKPEPRRNPNRVARSGMTYSEWDESPHSE